MRPLYPVLAFALLGAVTAALFTLFHAISLDAAERFAEILGRSELMLPLAARLGLNIGTSKLALGLTWGASIALMVESLRAPLTRATVLALSAACLAAITLVVVGLVGYWFVTTSPLFAPYLMPG